MHGKVLGAKLGLIASHAVWQNTGMKTNFAFHDVGWLYVGKAILVGRVVLNAPPQKVCIPFAFGGRGRPPSRFAFL